VPTVSSWPPARVAIEHARQRGRNRADRLTESDGRVLSTALALVNQRGHPNSRAADSGVPRISGRKRPPPRASAAHQIERHQGACASIARSGPATHGVRLRTVSLGTTSMVSLENSPL